MIILLVLLVVLRLPSINRPVSKHHEFNTAVILINAESWEQAGGGKAFNYTPLLNYQGSSNRPLEKGAHIDAKGNHVYLSFGAGWYVLPWFVFKGLHIAFTPVNLRILSILAGLLTVLLLYRLILNATGERSIAFSASAIFAFLPAPLWYCGIGYVTTSIMLPFVLGLLHAWQRIEKGNGKRQFLTLALLFICGVLCCYFDWSGVFLLAAIFAWSLLHSLKEERFIMVMLVAGMAAATGVGLVLWQFSEYVSWSQVTSYWKSRFSDRSSGNGELSFFRMVIYIFRNIIIGFLPLVIVMYAGFKNSSYKTLYLKASWTFWALTAALMYNLIFFNWSANHEFAWMLPALLLVIFLAVNFFRRIKGKALNRITMATLFVSVMFYFLINLPGPVNISGEHYDSKKQLATIINGKVDKGTSIFINTNADKILEYYCKRTFNSAADIGQVVKTCNAFGIKKAAFLTMEKGTLKKITYINK